MNDMVVSVPPAASFLSVGLPLKISLSLDQQKVMYGSTLLGWKDHAWLICEWPLQLGHDQQVVGGTPCTVSYLHEGKLVGYRSEIRDLLSSPVPLLFIAYPKTVEEMHLRKHVRVSSNEPILLMRTDPDHSSQSSLPTSDYFGGLLKDLSEGVQRGVGPTTYLAASRKHSPFGVRTAWLGTHYQSHRRREECRRAAWERDDRY